MAEIRRNVLLALVAGWAVLLLLHAGTRVSGLAARWPTVHADDAKRAEIESGNAELHAFFSLAARSVPAGSRLLVLAYDPQRDDTFEYYRAEYELFPTWSWFAPIGFAPTGAARFTLPVDPAFLNLVRTKELTLAAVWNKLLPAKSRVYALAANADGKLVFSPAAPKTDPLPAALFAVRHPWGWPAGLAALVALGWLFNAVTGLAAPFGADLPARAALALLTGSGLTVFGMVVTGLAGVRWSVATCLLPWALLPAGWAWIRRRGVPSTPAPVPAAEPLGVWNIGGLALVGAAGALAAAEAALPMSAWSNWDAWAIWNLKAKAFWLAGGFPKEFLQEPLFDFMHPDYPPGLPMLQAFLGSCAGGLHESLLRGLSVAFYLMLAALLARLLLELGAGRWRWLLAGLFVFVPKVLEQASSGYADLVVSGFLVGALVFLVRALRGDSPPWTVGLMCGLAALLKNEGLVMGAGCIGLLGLHVLRRRLPWKAVAVAAACFGVLVLPWRAVNKGWNLNSTFKVDTDRMQNNLPEQGPVILKAAVLEAAGIPLTMPMLTGRGPVTTEGWGTHLRDSWLLLWYAVAAGLVLGATRLLRSPAPELAALLALQLAATWAVYLGAQYNVVWLCLTSLDRLLLQVAPLAFALAAGVVLGR